MSRSLKLLVDCNVWVDSYITPRANHEESLAFVNDALESGATLLFGASKLETILYVLRSEAKRILRIQKSELSDADAGFTLRFAWGCIDNLCEIATAVGLDESDLWLARQYRTYHGDLEDTILLAAATRSHADYLVTWDKSLLRNAAAVVRAVTPYTMRLILAAEKARGTHEMSVCDACPERL